LQHISKFSMDILHKRLLFCKVYFTKKYTFLLLTLYNIEKFYGFVIFYIYVQMTKNILILLLLAIAAYGQQERIAIIQTLDDRDSIGFSELSYLTDRLRETAVNILPKQRYGIMTTESIVAFLGSQERAMKTCKEASCLAELGRKVNADYVAQARIGRFGDNLTIKTELYDSRKGNLMGSFTGSSKDIYGLLALIDEKAADALFRKMPGVSGGSNAPFVAGGISGLEKTADYELGGGKRYLVNLSTEPQGAVLSFDGVPSPGCPKTPCKIELGGGGVRIIAALEQHEVVDTTVSISSNNQSIVIRLKSNFGFLDIKPAYIDGIGEYEDWKLSINDKVYDSFENRFSPGNYNVKLSHKCYELVSFMAGINKGSREVFDMAGNIKLKKGGLDLSVERDGEPVVEPVFVNGNRMGDTPFSDAIPLCSYIEVGEGRETVNVALKHNEKVRYVYKGNLYAPVEYTMVSEQKKPGKASFWVGLGLEMLGAAIIYAGYSQHKDMWDAYDSGNYSRRAWEEDVESKHSARNALYTAGGILLASGVGVHIWF